MTQQERGPSTMTNTPAPPTPRPTESIDRLRSEANIARYADELAEAHHEDIYAVLDWAEALAKALPDWCGLIGTFMGQEQYCGEPRRSRWHQPGDEAFKHEFVPLTLTPALSTPAEPLDVDAIGHVLDALTMAAGTPYIVGPLTLARHLDDAWAEYARLRSPESDR